MLLSICEKGPKPVHNRCAVRRNNGTLRGNQIVRLAGRYSDVRHTNQISVLKQSFYQRTSSQRDSLLIHRCVQHKSCIRVAEVALRWGNFQLRSSKPGIPGLSAVGKKIGTLEQFRQATSADLLQIARGRHRIPLIFHQQFSMKDFWFLARETNGNVRFTMIDIHSASGWQKCNGNRWVSSVKLCHRGNQPETAERWECADADDVPFVDGPTEDSFEHFQGRSHLLMEVGSFSAQRHHAGCAIEQRAAEQLLQFANAVTYRTIGNVEVIGGLIEALSPGHRIEGHDQVNRGNVTHESK